MYQKELLRIRAGGAANQPALPSFYSPASALARIDPVLCAQNDPPRPREERQATPRFAARQTRSRGRRRQPGRSNRFPHAGSRPWKVRALRASARMMGIHPARLSGVDDIAGHPPCNASNRVLGVGQSNRAQMGNSCRAPKEPNSGLGKAMKYLLRHWHKLGKGYRP